MHIFDRQAFPAGSSICNLSGIVTSVTYLALFSFSQLLIYVTDKHQTDIPNFSSDD